MGRIKQTMVKRASEELLEHQTLQFTPQFNDNKKILADTMPSKKIRNKIAGYIARLKKAEEKPRKIKEKAVKQEEEIKQYEQY